MTCAVCKKDRGPMWKLEDPKSMTLRCECGLVLDCTPTPDQSSGKVNDFGFSPVEDALPRPLEKPYPDRLSGIYGDAILFDADVTSIHRNVEEGMRTRQNMQALAMLSAELDAKISHTLDDHLGAGKWTFDDVREKGELHYGMCGASVFVFNEEPLLRVYPVIVEFDPFDTERKMKFKRMYQRIKTKADNG